MKTHIDYLLIVAWCCTASLLSGCKENSPIEPPAPPFLNIYGHVTDESGQPLPAIQITVADEGLTDWENINTPTYTDLKGEHNSYHSYIGSDGEVKEWPDEIMIIAADTTGVYKPQSLTAAVEVRKRYSGDSIQWSKYYDGYVSADFVLKKK